TYLGGSEDPSRTGFGGRDSGSAIAIDSAGNAYVTGSTDSGNFPIVSASAFQSTLSLDTFGDPTFDGFVTKLNPTGSALVYSSFLGGNGDDFDERIVLDSASNAYIVGSTDSTNLPVRSAFQTNFRGIDSNAFVAKMNLAASGSASLVYLTYLGGSGNDFGLDIAVDGQGNAYVTGDTTSATLPITPDAPHPTSGGGDDAFITKLSPAGSALVYSTYLGGSDDDVGHGIAVDGSQNVYVTGSTLSTNFPTTSGAFQLASGGGTDAFVTKLVDSQPGATHFSV